MKSKSIIGLICLVVLLFGFFPFENYPINYPANWPKPNYDYLNKPLRQSQVELGRKLFYDSRLSKDSSQSCESCHSPFNAFAHTDHQLSHGIHDSIGTRNAPALFNMAWQKEFMWDGAIKSLKEQARFPISHPGEMGFSMKELVSRLSKDSVYREAFEKAFNQTSINEDMILTSLQSFMLTLISQNSKYDRVMAGLDSFSAMEAKGYQLFKSHCNTCHSEPLFSNFEMVNNGLKPDDYLQDSGRSYITHELKDLYKFKTPSLRNLEYSYPYMHDGRFASLYDVVTHYSEGIYFSNSLDPRLKKGIPLTKNEKTEIVSFLLTLNDLNFVFSKEFGFPRKKY